MSPDYSVTGISMYSPSNSSSSKNFQALIMRKQDSDALEKKNVIANLTDDEILLTSINYAQKKTDKTVAGKLLNALPSLFITAVPLVFGALHKGSLSDKTKTALTTAAIFGGSFALMDKYDNGMGRIENASKNIEKTRKEHPVAAGLFDLAAKGALLAGASMAAVKSGKYLQNKFKPTAEKISKSIAKTSEKIDKSLLGRGVEKLNNKSERFLNKHPKISNFISKSSFLAPVTALLGWIGFEGAVRCKALETKYNLANNKAEELFIKREFARSTD